MQQQIGEPSVEDILESIKKVIARDTPRSAPVSRETTQRPAAPAPAPAPVLAETRQVGVLDDVLDLASAQEVDAAPASPLINPGASASMRDSLAALAMLSQPSAPPQIVRSGETSLEELTRDLLRPALAAWLDAHLPAMVEKMVAAEIARIVGKKG